MIPRPIALLTLFYAVIAAASSARLWQVWNGWSHASPGWLGLWLVLSVSLIGGLTGMKPWARTLAVWASGLLTVSALGVAMLVLVRSHPEPGLAALMTGFAGLQVALMRFFTRPHVKQWFLEVAKWPSGKVAK